MVKMYLYAKNEVPLSVKKLQPEQTHPTEIITYGHTRMVNINEQLYLVL